MDLYDLFIKGNSSANLKIQSGDVLLINPIEKQIKIFGEVNNEAIFELKENETFDDLIVFASGFKPLADKNKIILTRQSIDNEIFVKEMSSEDLNNFPLMAGDSIFIDRLPSVSVDANKSRREGVTLEGAFVNPGKYYLKDERKSGLTIAGATVRNEVSTSLRENIGFPDHIKRILDFYKVHK